jgi:hypothetical protein
MIPARESVPTDARRRASMGAFIQKTKWTIEICIGTMV